MIINKIAIGLMINLDIIAKYMDYPANLIG
jgi:hypothetical protein